MKKWEVKSKGKIQRFMIFFGGLSGLSLYYILTAATEGIAVLLAFFPIWLPVLLVTISRLAKSKVPTQIQIDTLGRKVIINYSRSKVEELVFEQIAFSKIDPFGSYVCLTFYKTFEGTRGQLVTKKLTDVIGLKWTLSWKKHQVFEILAELESNNILEMEPENRELPLWERLI